jgi:hypothetical protein
MTDIFRRPSRPPNPELGFTTLGQYQDVSTYLQAWYKGKKNDSPIELGSDLGLRTAQEHRSSTLPAEEARTYCVRLCPLLECVSCQRARQVRTTYRSRARCPHARYVLRTAPARCLHDRRSRVAGSCSSRQM